MGITVLRCCADGTNYDLSTSRRFWLLVRIGYRGLIAVTASGAVSARLTVSRKDHLLPASVYRCRKFRSEGGKSSAAVTEVLSVRGTFSWGVEAAVCMHISYVLGASAPAKIRGPIVRLVIVQMANLITGFRLWAMECQADGDVPSYVRYGAVFTMAGELVIAALMAYWLQ